MHEPSSSSASPVSLAPRRLLTLALVLVLVAQLLAPIAGFSSVALADDATPTAATTTDATTASTDTPTPEPTLAPTDTPTQDPTATDTPTQAPVATDTPAPQPTATDAPIQPTATDAPAAQPTNPPTKTITGTPTITSDKADYNPGALVVLTGVNWQPGETVHIYVNDDAGSTWSRNVDVTADANGTIADSFNLPNWFVADYSVTATGSISGVAKTAFTDGNVTLHLLASEGVANMTITYDRWNGNAVCNATITPTFSNLTVSVASSSGTVNIPGFGGSGDSVLLKSVTTTTNGKSFSSWTIGTPQSDSGTVVSGSPTPCISNAGGTNGNIGDLYAHFQTSIISTSLAVSSATGTYGGTVSLSATLSPNVGGKTISFSLNGTSVGTGTTNASGVATLNNASLGTIGAGTYASGVSASFAGDGSYASSNGTASLTVNKAPLTVTADNKSKTYGDANPTFTASYSGFVNSETSAVLGGTLAFSTTATASSGVGNYDVTPSGLTSGNYAITFVKGKLTINARAVTVTADAKSKVFGTSDPTLTYQITSGSLVNGDALSGSLIRVAGEDVGTYAIQQSTLALSSNYALTYVGANLTITAKAVTITPNSGQGKVYGSTDPALTFTNDGGLAAGAFTGSLARAAGEAVGGYAINLGSLSAGSNYTLSLSTPTVNFAITKATLTVTADNKSKTYGQDNPTLTWTYSGFKFSDTANVLSGAPSIGTAATPSSGAGSYPITISIGSLAAANYSFSFVNGTLSVGQAVLSVNANDLSKTYGAADPTPTYSLSGFVNGDTAGTVTTTGSPSCAVASHSEDVGSYSNVFTCEPNTLSAANYSFAAGSAGKLTINQAPLTVTTDAASKTYGDANPAFSASYSGFKFSDGPGSLDGTLAFSTSATAASPVGGYDVTPSGLTSSNYAITFVTGTLTIGKAPLTVTADNQSKTYGDANPPLTGTLTGIKNGDNITATYGTSATASSPVGGYDITPSLNDPNGKLGNYSVTITKGTLTVGRAALTITTKDAAKFYGDSNPSFSVDYSGFVNGDGPSSLGGTLAFSTAADETSSVGGYDVTPSGQTSSNYTITFIAGTLTINPRPVEVTADPQTKVYGDADPGLTYKITNGSLVNGDTFSGALTRDPGDNVGSYPITQGNLALTSNYDLTFVGANLTITARPIEITADAKTKTYGDLDPALTYTITDGDLVGTDSFTGSLARAAGENVGSYAITQGTVTAGSNYALTYKGANLTITAKAATVTADNKSKTYGGADPDFTFTATGLINDDTLAGVTCGVAADHVNAGPYAIDCSGNSNANYDVAYVSGTLTVNPAALTIKAKDKNKTYGDADPSFDVSYSGFVNGDGPGSLSGALTFTIAGTGTTTYGPSATIPTDAGTYSIAPSGLTSNNYDITFEDGGLTIAKASLTVTADHKARIYGTANPAFTATITGFVNSQTLATSGVTGTPDLSTTAAATSPVGDYPITAGLGTLAAANYSFTFVDGTLTVGKATLTVTADDKTKTYGDANPPFTAGYAGFKNGETLATSGVTGSPSLSTTASNGSAVGNYPITAALGTLAATNYSFSFVNGTLKVTTRAVTVTADAQTKVYGDADPDLTYQITNGSLANGDAFSGALTRDPGEDVGSYAITKGNLALSANYSLTYIGANLAITARPVTVTADSGQTKTYGDADPAAFSYKVTSGNLIGTDAFTGSLTRATGENVGSYAITQGTLALSGNYDLTYAAANFSITARPIAIMADAQTKVYGDSDPALTYHITSGSLVGTDAFTGSLTRVVGENVGSYAITQGTVALSANYSLTYVGANLTITKATLTVTADNKTKTYGADNPTFTANYSGFKNGETLATSGVTGSPSVTTSATATSPVGSYTITAAQGTLAAGNYTFSFVNGTLTVNKAVLSVSAGNLSKTVGDPDPTPTWSLSGFVNGESASTVTITGLPSCTIATHPESAGIYTGVITCAPGTLSAVNYTFATGSPGMLTIIYGFAFLQPINYTAHGITSDTSVFKAGSTIPVKFSLYDTAGNVLPCQGTAQWLGYQQTSTRSTSVNEITYSDPTTAGSNFTCSNGLYQYNWSTKGLQAGYYYLITVRLPDGENRSVYIGLK